MTIDQALEIVLNLAEGNCLTDKEAAQDLEILKPEQIKQEKACEVVRDFITARNQQ